VVPSLAKFDSIFDVFTSIRRLGTYDGVQIFRAIGDLMLLWRRDPKAALS